MLTFDLGELHPAIIHFPIALIFTALVFDILVWYTKNEIFQSIASWLIVIAAIILVPTALTGFLAEDFYPANDPDVFRHQNMAIATAIFTIGYAVFRGYVLYNNRLYPLYLYLLLSLFNVGLVSITAEFGGIVVRGKGILFESLRPTGAPLPYNIVK